MDQEQYTKEDLPDLIEKAKSQPYHLQNTQGNCDRLTGRVSFAHQSCLGDPVHVSAVFSMQMKDKEQPYVRRMIVGEEEKKLDANWLERVGYIFITNKRLAGHGSSMSPEERVLQEEHFLIVSVSGIPVFKIRPGHCFVAEMMDPNRIEAISIRSSFGEVPVIITAMPE